ncbi:MAG: hypothetical protein LBT05_02090 [Planctomycetaceae bacterium]|jgi:hypothetical protein|nr:hypothetical protein [Planctomycetaceae bacterium]
MSYAKAFNDKIFEFQKAWGYETKAFPTKPSDENVVTVAKELLIKYEKDFD